MPDSVANEELLSVSAGTQPSSIYGTALIRPTGSEPWRGGLGSNPALEPPETSISLEGRQRSVPKENK